MPSILGENERNRRYQDDVVSDVLREIDGAACLSQLDEIARDLSETSARWLKGRVRAAWARRRRALKQFQGRQQ